MYNTIMNGFDKLLSFTKSFSFEKGALVVLSIFPTVTFNEILEEIFRDIEMKRIVLPLIVFGILTPLYLFVASMDFSMGLRASKYEHWKKTGLKKGYIDNEKLWNTVWKLCGVLVITSIFTIFSMLFAIIGIGMMNTIFTVAISVFYFVVILFEIHSIGESQERRFGKKSPHFKFMEDVTNVVKVGVIQNISKLITRLFGNRQDDYGYQNYNDNRYDEKKGDNDTEEGV